MTLAQTLRNSPPISPGRDQAPLFDEYAEVEEELRAVPTAVLVELELALEAARSLAQFALARERSARPTPVELGSLAWATDLTPEDFETFAGEYIDSIASAILKNEWDAHELLLMQWRDTAGIERNPELAERLRPEDPDTYSDLSRPTPA